MRLTARNKKRDSTLPLMVWSVTDEVIENKDVRGHEFRELANAGFGGVAAFVRCTRYSWDDPLAMAACRDIIRMSKKHGMTCWLAPDPRFVSHKLTNDSSGLELLLFGDAARAETVPNFAPINRGRYSVRCKLASRHVHTLTDVAVEFYPLEIARVYAFKPGTGGKKKGDIVDITRNARMFYNARDRYVEAFGSVPDGVDDQWSVIAFFHVRTNHVDFSSSIHLQRYEKILTRLKSAGCSPDGIMWDEPGYTCIYGSIPYSPVIRKSYRTARGRNLGDELWKIVFESDDHSDVPVRLAYYASVQNSILKAESRLEKTAHRLWGPKTVVGIHDTWHFESADMCDMNHGSLDLWKTAKAKSGGFVDLGGIQVLADPASSYYSNLAAMSVMVTSLAKTAQERVAYNNLWTVGDEDIQGQRDSMDHCIKIMGLFGTRWLAHAYGPVGTIGQERTFLGSPPLPGYPDHSTWQYFPAWNSLLSAELKKTDGALPNSNLLLLYPVESLYALADRRADNAAAGIFSLLLALVDEHFHLDVLSTTSLQRAQWKNNQFCAAGGKYDFVIFPYPEVVGRKMYRLFTHVKGRSAFMFGQPRWYEDGKKMPAAFEKTGMYEILQRVLSMPDLRPVQAPKNCWVTMTVVKHGTIISLAPSRARYRFEGEVRFNDKMIVLEETDQLKRILFPRTGAPKII